VVLLIGLGLLEDDGLLVAIGYTIFLLIAAVIFYLGFTLTRH
jgi:hypothetical protein